ncbi:MAG: DUF5131 family protein [Dehalococcoidia bacterium]|nr:DUF5131 family protein [Dehalococcoidia bacterium]
MGEKTGIAWTDATWNPVYGCSEVSPGCDNCYAKRDMARFGKPWKLTRAKRATFEAPLRWKEPRRVFVCSWGDLFHPLVPQGWMQEIWDIMLATPQHTYQLLTKRPGRMAWWAQAHSWRNHIWAGTSIESAKYLPRLDVLERVPAKIRFASLEPLLERLDLRPWLWPRHGGYPVGHVCKGCLTAQPLSWVVAGGESGPNHRPMQIEWVQDIADQCTAAHVPLFVKQGGSLRPGQQGDLPDSLWAIKEMPREN